MILTPRVYQNEIHTFGLELPRGNVFAGMGMGKTPASLMLFDTLWRLGEAERALVIAPRRVALFTWPEELAKWGDTFPHLRIAAAVGTEQQRIAALASNAQIVTINYDNLPWLVEVMGGAWNFDTVFADESPHLKGLRVTLQTSKLGNEFTKGQGSSRAKAISKVAHTKVRRWYNLTGSPAPNGLQDLWGQMWFVDAGARLGTSFDAFTDRYFRSIPGSGGYGSQLEPLPFADPQIKAAIKDVCTTIDPKDYFDLKAPIERRVMVRLPPKARKQYLQMEKEFFAEIGGFDVEAFNSGAKSSKCAQIANGAAYVDRDGTWEIVHDEKLDALRSIVTEANGAPLLIRYCFKPDMHRILKAFPHFKLLDNDPQTIRDFQAGRIPGLLTHAKSAGHGLSLQASCWILVDYSADFNLEHDEQIIERIGPMRQMQSGFTDRAVFRYRIVAEDTVEDNAMLPRLVTKASVQDSLKAAMKRRQLG